MPSFFVGAYMAEIKIEYLPIDQVKPYAKNTRKHDAYDVGEIAKSIELYGFCDPIGIWGDNIIVEGHGRLMAAKKLNMKEVPCIRLDHMTDEQRRAYGIVHNKTAELSEYDYDYLTQELQEIDLSDFSFDFPEIFEFESLQEENFEEDADEKENERLRTDNAYHFWDFDSERTEGKWQMPIIEPCYKIPKRMIGFNYALTSTDYDACIHFYLDDYQFERVWNSPAKYMEILKRFDMVLSPSYSVYMDIAEPIKIYNVFRSRLLSQMMQDNGIYVVPIVYWADEKSFEYCFDGLPENSVLSVLTIGTTNKEVWKHWKRGMDELIKRKNPKVILLYGNGIKVDYDFGNIKVIYYRNDVTERMKGLGKQ